MEMNARLAAAMVLAQVWILPVHPVAAHADALSDWTGRAQAITTEQGELPPSRARALAIVHIAVFEAIESAERVDTPHQFGISASRGISREAAAAAAAHDVLVALYPDRAPDLSPALAASLAGIANGIAKARGYAVGKNAAAAVLARWLRAPGGKKEKAQIGDLIGDTRR